MDQQTGPENLNLAGAVVRHLRHEHFRQRHEHIRQRHEHFGQRRRPAETVGFALMRRVSVVGASGSGKSTLARELAACLAVPHVELDAIFHQPDWAPLPEDEFARRVADAAAGDEWVIDGNYSRVLPLIWARADTVIWLSLPRRIIMRRLIWRTIRRAATRAELWNGNRERWQNLFSLDQEKSVIAWSWHHYPVYQERYAAARRDPAYAHLKFVQLTGNADMHSLLGSAPQPAPSDRCVPHPKTSWPRTVRRYRASTGRVTASRSAGAGRPGSAG